MKFSRLIDASIEWTTAVLFRPFNVKKWLILGFIALMAGALAGNGNFRLNLPVGEKENKNTEITQTHNRSIEQSFQDGLKQFKQSLKDPLTQVLIVSGVLLFLALTVFLTWICARFVFVFLESVVKNDASVKIPFHSNKTIGNSLFKFWITITVIMWIILGVLVYLSAVSLIKSGVFDKPPTWESVTKFVSIILPSLSVLIFVAIIAVLTGFFINHFAVPVMFKRRLNFLEAVRISMQIISENKKEVFLYFWLFAGLRICAWIISGLLYMAGFLGIIFPAIIFGAVCYAVYALLPPVLHAAYLIILAVIFVPVLVFMSYCLICLYLPFGVFLRTFNIKFLAAVDPEYDLFKFQ